jgi:hypothetical protein
MNEDIERRFRRVSPRGAPPELRPRVLAAIADELPPPISRPSRRAFYPGLAAAAGVLIGVASNFWVTDALDRRLAIVLGPPPVSRQAEEIAAEVASITDPTTGRWAYERLVASRPPDHDARHYAIRLQQMIQELTFDPKETANEATHKNPQMDRDRRGSRDRRPVDAQCLVRLEYGNTA